MPLRRSRLSDAAFADDASHRRWMPHRVRDALRLAMTVNLRPAPISRRHLLRSAAALLPLVAVPSIARAQIGTTPPPKQPAPDELSPKAPVAIEVNARPLPSFDLRDRSHVRFGALEFRSGLVLTSSFRGFGGLSGLRIDAAGRKFVAISDKGVWFTGRIEYRGREMTGLADVEAAPLLASDGRPIRSRGWYDSESLAFDGATAYVGLERANLILRYDFGRDGVRASGELVPVPPAVRKLPLNQGLESLVVVRKGLPLAGTLMAISERGLDADGNILAFLIGGPTPGQFSVRRTNDYDISDATLLPAGDLLLLERKFSFVTGVGIRIRRVALNSIAPGALVDGPSIFEADLGYEIDNLEGIDTHVNADGETILTLVSDDNFSMIQRTLLLQFALIE